MKTKLQFVITAIGVVVFMQMNAVVYADQAYSAVASTSTPNGGAVGYGTGYSSRNNADVTALNQCHSQSKGQCYIVARFRGAGCVAIARGEGVLGWGVISGYSNDREAAQNEALNECNSRGYGCHITQSDCTSW